MHVLSLTDSSGKYQVTFTAMRLLQTGFLKVKLFGFCILFLSLFSACQSTKTLQHPATRSTLWVQHSAEYDALTVTIYKAAANYLELALKNSQWTAYPPQQGKNIRSLPPAIIVDVDETVLDNSAFQARMIKQGRNYSSEAWNSWVMEAKAEATPGALNFLRAAAKRNIDIYYLTNREAKVEEGTQKNLKALGFPFSDSRDHILSKNEQPEWTSKKANRRAAVASNHRILMLFGDNLNDFIPAENISKSQRANLVSTYYDMWGKKWFILPNPMYGSWEKALYNFEDLSPSEIRKQKVNQLDTKQ